MNVPANSAQAAQQAATPKQPAWMSYATLDELNAYIKRSKMGTIRGDEIRAAWTAAHQQPEVQPQPETLVLSGDMKEIPLQDGVASHPDDEQPQQDVADAAADVIAKASAKPPKSNGTLSGLQRKQEVPLQPLAPVAQAAQSSLMTTRYIDPRHIDVKDDWNARTDMGDLEELGRQIAAQKKIDGVGLLHDIRVQEKGDGSGRYWLVDGERRWQAVMGLIDAGEDFSNGIPAKVEPASASAEDLTIKMFLANEGKPLLPYEEGLFFKRLQASGMTMKEMEEKTGRSDSSIWYALALVEADEDLVDAIRKGTIGTTIAKTIAVNARGDKQRQKELVAKAKQIKVVAKTSPAAARQKTAELKKEIDEDRRKKAAKERPGLTLKARKADEAEISRMGNEVGAALKERLQQLGLSFDTDMEEWIGNDRELQVAANFGALAALKAIMGVKCKVTF